MITKVVDAPRVTEVVGVMESASVGEGEEAIDAGNDVA